MAVRNHGNSKRSATTSASISSVGFSAFLMDEVPDFSTRSQRNGARPHVFPAGVPIAVPNLPPPATAGTSARSPVLSTAVARTTTSSSSRGGVALTNTTTTTNTAAAVAVARTRSQVRREQDDIPVLEAGGYNLSDDFDDVILAHDDDGDSDNSDDSDADELADDVPVLQTLEDAAHATSTRGNGLNKKFSWRESSRHVTAAAAARKKSKHVEPRVPDAAMLLRMSSQTDVMSSLAGSSLSLSHHNSFSTTTSTSLSLTTSSSSGSLISRKGPPVFVDEQIVLKGWLYKQADILKTWKRRYFVLIKRTNTTTGEFSAALVYYRGSHFGKARGEISLQDGPITVRFLEASETKRPFCFEVAGADFAFVCHGEDDEDVSAWVCHLQSLTGSAGEMLSATAVGTAAAGGLQPGGLAGGAVMDDRSIRIVAELRRLLHTSKSAEATKCKAFIRSFECKSVVSLRQLRDFHATLTNSIVRDHASRLVALLDDGSSATKLTIDDIRSAVSRHVEEVLCAPLHDSISAFLRRACYEDDAAINRKVRWLQGKDQTYYNIPTHQISWKEWRRASKVLAQVAHVALPSAKYDVLLATIAAIQTTFRDDHRASSNNATTTGGGDAFTVAPLETDDVIPIFTYVLANSGLENLLAIQLLLTELNGAWAVGGALDDGAALSVLQHAIELISNVSIPAVLEDIFKDQITLSIDGDWQRVLELDVEPTYRYGAVVHNISPHGYSAVGSKIMRGFVLVTVNGQNVVLWPFHDIAMRLQASVPPHRLAFIPASSYFKILTSTKSLWNVALVHACQRGDISSVQMLLANGADVNYVALECGGNSPLHIAVSARHFNVVSYILQHGAKVRTRGECGRTALHMLGTPCTLPSTTTTTLGASAVSTSVAAASTTVATTNGGRADRTVLILQKLLAHGAELEPLDIYGNTPLMLLAETGALAAIDALVEADGGFVDLNARNWKRGMNALALAARAGRFDVVEALLDYGVQVDMVTLRGETALHFAAGMADVAICHALVDKGADVDARTTSGRTPLMVAVARGHGLTLQRKTSESNVQDAAVVATVDFFLAHGAALDAVCELYRLPLHYAALFGSAHIYEHVLEAMTLMTIALATDADGKSDQSAAAIAAAMAAASDTRDLFGETAAAMTQRSRPLAFVHGDSARNSAAATAATANHSRHHPNGDTHLDVDVDDDDSDDDSDDEDDLVDDAAIDIPLSLRACPKSNSNSEEETTTCDIVLEERDGKSEIVAGTFEAIGNELLQADAYQVDEMHAFIWFCDYGGFAREMVDFLRELLQRYADTTAGLYVRRMVLHALDKIVQNLKHQVACDSAVCDYISAFCSELFPFAIDDDPQCAQWLSLSLLPLFVDACRTHRLAEFQVLTYCEDDYVGLKQFLVAAKQSQTRRSSGSMDQQLPFLDDELFATARGIEIITESMRRRLSIAGVWTPDVKLSYVVKHDDTDRVGDDRVGVGGDEKQLMRTASQSSMTAWQLRGGSGSSNGLVPSRSFTTGSSSSSRMWLLDIDASAIAQQMTLFQHYLFSKIKVSEVLATKKSAEKTPAYQRLRLLHNHISVWVVSQILARDDLDQRAEVLAYFIKVAGVLLKPLQNLDGFMAVMNATNDSSIYRLKKTWGRLSPQMRDSWHELKQFTEKGARPLNKLTKEGEPPLIPYMGVVIQNIIALQEFPDRVDGDRINFKKIRSIGGLIQKFLSFQQAPYLLPTDKRVLDFICTSLQYPSADACFARSLKVEPRVQAPLSGS